MKPFGIDIDDVLAKFAPKMHACLNSRYPGIKPVSEWDTFFWSEINGIPYDSFIQHIIEDDLLTTCEAIPSAVRAMNTIRDSGHQIVLITSRGYHPRAYELTHAWLTRNNIPFDDLVIVPAKHTKAQATIGKYPKGFMYMIDDNADNLDDMKEAGLVTNTILIDQPWNQSRKDYKAGISRFQTLSDFVFALKQPALRDNHEPVEQVYRTVY
jgi:uncharacterized HAD superfamily protein